MHDIVIRNGTLIDGTGAPGVMGDLAIKGGRIVEMGKVSGVAARTLDAEGAVVTPGFIDVHTHYDGQFLWDDKLDPSFSHGVTTAIAGNCGVGFAPAEAHDRKNLIEMMEGVEDIPGIVLEEGLDWSWRTFPEYMDRLAQGRYTMDVATHFAHAPLRVFVMGERGLNHERPTDDDLEKMQHLVREAMAAGAVGVSGSRVLEHKTSKGAAVPGTFSEDRELIALARAMGETGKGTFEIAPLGAAGDTVGSKASTPERMEEHARYVRIAEACGRPVTYLMHAHHHAPDEWRQMMDESQAANARGLRMYPQIAPRGSGLLLALDGYHVFRCRPSYMEIAHLPRAARAAAMREPERRRAILSETNVSPEQAPTPRIWRLSERFAKELHHFYALTLPLDYEPDPSKRFDAIAAATGRTLEEVLYDTLSTGDGRQLAVDFAMNYIGGNLDMVYDQLILPHTVSGLGDAGAHLLMVCDAGGTTFHLSFWARDRKRGPILPLEAMVQKITGQAAEVYGLNDRGVLKLGARADVNVIDMAKLGNNLPEMVFDLPMGGGRFVQSSSGYRATLVHGDVTRLNDQDTGARPGRLLRA